MQRRDWPGNPLYQQQGVRNGIIKSQYKVCCTSAVLTPIFSKHHTHKIHSESQDSPPHFVQYLISYLTASLALTQQPQQYHKSTVPESAERIQYVSHEGSVRVTKAACERK